MSTSTTTSTTTKTTTSTSTPSTIGTSPAGGRRRPSVLRRTALVAATVVASVPATVWGIGTVVQMATGVERDHLFHQVVGQGLMLSALWLAASWPLLSAGWRGRRPSLAAAWHTIGFALAAAVAGALSPVAAGGGTVSAFAVVTLALVWWAVPVKPALRAARLAVDPVLAPVVALLSALHVTFAVSESALQRAMGDEHAHMAHNYDMAWVSLALVAFGVAGALLPEARRLLLWTTLGSVVIGVSRFVITGEVWWSLAVTALGVVGAAVLLLRRRPASR